MTFVHTKLVRQCINAAKSEAKKQGVGIHWEPGSKHYFLTVERDGHSRKVALSFTSQNDNQPHWVAQHVRRLSKELEREIINA